MSKKIHIVHVIYRFDTGGLENGIVNLINRLEESSYKHSIITLCGRSELFCQRIKTDNVEYFDLAKKPGQDLGMFLRLNRLLVSLKPDIFHTRNTATIECQVIAWWRRIPLRIHGEHGWDVNDLGGSNLRYRKLRRVLKPFIHQYIALSSEAVIYLQSHIKISNSKIQHICNGVDYSKFSPNAAPVKSSFVVGCVGRLEAVKNHQLLVKAFALVKINTDKNIKLHLIGDGSLATAIKQQCKENNIEDDVWMPGNREDVDTLMKSFDVFILPSLAEGISNTILEAMAVGLPVIATKVGGNPDLIENNKTGFLVNPDDPKEMADKITCYINNAATLKTHGENSRTRVEQTFSLEVMTQKYQTVYQEFFK
jgi:sugar transferase (PEP-CTERM/EpsH1 system associated)